MSIVETPVYRSPGPVSVPNFRTWQRDVINLGLLPVIGIAGGRGKSTVLRMLDHVLRLEHLRTATWSDLGVEIRGRRQRGEISGWSTALARIAESTVDVAIQELDWSTVNAVGLPPSSYPVMVMTNLNGGHDAPLDDQASITARRGVHRASTAVHPAGMQILCGDDPAVLEATQFTNASVTITSLSGESARVRRHLDSGGSAVWMRDHELWIGDGARVSRAFSTELLSTNGSDAAQFHLTNALLVTAVATSIGIDVNTIARGLASFEANAEILPGSFNRFKINDFTALVDRTTPSWNLRGLLRAANPSARHRQITVIGNLEKLPAGDIREVGRLVGRYRGAIILHSNKDSSRVEAFRRGVAANEFPPLMIHLPTERRALNRALKTARMDDLVLVLTDDDPGPSIRALRRLSTKDAIEV